MDFLQDMIFNPLIAVPLLAWVIAQLSKTVLHALLSKEFRPERLVGAGGMPSSHSATVCALATAVGFEYGAGGFEFAIVLVFAIIVMHDAMGVRREAGNQARTINEIMEALVRLGDKQPVDEKLKEFVGHTPIQVLAGALTGIATGVVVCGIL